VHGPNFCHPSRDHTRPRTSDNILRFGDASRKVLLPAAEEKKHHASLNLQACLYPHKSQHRIFLFFLYPHKCKHRIFLFIFTYVHIHRLFVSRVYTTHTVSFLAIIRTPSSVQIFFSLPSIFKKGEGRSKQVCRGVRGRSSGSGRVLQLGQN
jgi:hypothetical protein